MDVYIIVSSWAKRRCLRSGKVWAMHNIDPESCGYETEEGIMNCFGSLKWAETVLKGIRGDKRVSIIGFSIPDGCMVRRVQGFPGGSKADCARYAREVYGIGNYVSSFPYGGYNIGYLVLSDISCLAGMFDPLAGKCEGRPLQQLPPMLGMPVPMAQAGGKGTMADRPMQPPLQPGAAQDSEGQGETDAEPEQIEVEPLEETRYSTTNVKLRSGNSTTTEAIRTLQYAEEVHVVGITADSSWYAVEDSLGNKGYVASKYLSLEKPAQNAPAQQARQAPSESGSTQQPQPGSAKIDNGYGVAPEGISQADWDAVMSVLGNQQPYTGPTGSLAMEGGGSGFTLGY